MKLILIIVACAVVAGDARPQEGPRRVTIFRGHGGDKRVVEDVPKAPVIEEEEVKQVKATKVQTAKASAQEEEARIFRTQAENAMYAFETFVDDGIMGVGQSRVETRNGLSVEGMYSYNDGFYKRTVYYVADDKGYRVIKDENEPIGDGPIINLDGEAIVRSSLGSEYKITIDDYQKRLDERISEEI